MQSRIKLDRSTNGADETSADAFLECVDLMLQEGRNGMAYRLLKSLLQWQVKKQLVEERLNSLYRKWIPRWHFEMLNDGRRGQAFADALGVLNLRDKTVLDIGAGSGILSMLAVRRGARHVYACEMLEPLAEMAEEIVCRNGMAHKITVIPRSSFEVEIGRDIPERAEVMISETIDCGFVGEGFLRSLKHARQHLLQHSALLVPRAVQICGMLIESSNIHQLNHVECSQGFDVSGMNEFSTRGYFGVRLATRPYRPLSHAQILLELNLYGSIPQSLTRVLEFEAVETGVAHGVAFWFKVTLAPGVVLSNDPEQPESHWTQAFASFAEPVPVHQGGSYSVELTLTETSISIAPPQRAEQHRIAVVNGSPVRRQMLDAI